MTDLFTSGLRPKKTVVLLTLLAVIVCAGCGGDDDGDINGPQNEAESIRIGLLVPMSGSWVKGPAWRQAARMAIDEINDQGGVLGRPFELLVADTESVPTIAVEGARTLVDEGAIAIIGAGASSSSIQVSEQVLIPRGILLISPSSTSPAIRDLDDDDLVWRTVASDEFQGQLAARWAYDNGHRTTAIIYVDNAYGVGLSAAFTQGFEGFGGTVVESLGYPELSSAQIDAFDYSGVVERALVHQPDLVYLITYDQDGAKITVSASGYLSDDYRPTFLGRDGNTSQDFVDNSEPTVIEGMIGTLPIAPEGSPDYRAFVTRYVNRFGIEPESFSESTYDAIYLLALAILRAESVAPSQIAANLQAVSVGGTPIRPTEFASGRDLLSAGIEIDYNGAAGPLDFDERGDILSGTYRIWRVENGSFTVIETTVFP